MQETSSIEIGSSVNTSTITIGASQQDPSNSLASNVSQVTVVTTHPPILMDSRKVIFYSALKLFNFQYITILTVDNTFRFHQELWPSHQVTAQIRKSKSWS